MPQKFHWTGLMKRFRWSSEQGGGQSTSPPTSTGIQFGLLIIAMSKTN